MHLKRRPHHSWLMIAAIILGLVTVGSQMASGPPNPPPGQGGLYAPHVAGEILVKFKKNTGPNEHANARAHLNAQKVKQFKSSAQKWKLGPGWDVQRAIARMRGNPHVEYVEPNYIIHMELAPNDPRYPELYGMNNTGQTGGTSGADIDAERAWNVSTGSSDVVVAVIDTGIDYNHPDLVANIWTNPGEIPDNGIDDDGNGYVDDIHGWDFYNDDNDPMDDNYHGTHCAGTIGAVGDNDIGVAGVNWDVTLMALKFLNSSGSGNTDDAIDAIDYGTMMGVDIMSNSWGGGGFSQALLDSINAAGAAEIVFAAAAGNAGSDNDVSPHYPSNYDSPHIIAVAATDHDDARASFSSYGLTTVDLAAPGVDTLSTMPGNSYGLLSGTSMATPHVAGAAALIRAVAPGIGAVELKSVMMNFVDPVASMDGITVSGGRLNAFFPIAEPDDTPPGAITDLSTETPTSNSLFLRWTATGDDGDVGTASTYDLRYSTAPIDDTNFDAAMQAWAPPPQPSGATEVVEVLGLDPDTDYYFAVKAADEWGNKGPVSNVPMGTTLPPPTFASSPDSFTADLLTGQGTTRTLTIENAGVGTLDWTIPLPSVSGVVTTTQSEPLPLEKGEADPRIGAPVVSGFGGPDVYGYRWMDSDEPGGPVFSWTDISVTGTVITELDGDDQISEAIPLGFNFAFYGNIYDSVRVSTNGWISFTSTTASGTESYSNQELPTGAGPENLLAPFWDDLHFRSGNRAAYLADGGSFIVQYTDVDRYTTGSVLTFQMELRPTGEIFLRYLDVVGVLDNCTLGIQNDARNDGLTVAFNTAYLHDELEVRIAAVPQWLTAEPTEGRLWGGESAEITLTIDASGLDGGLYEGSVNVGTNDPLNEVVGHPVTMNVTGAPAIQVQPLSLDFGEVFLGYPESLSLLINNTGTDTLNVTGIASGDPTVTVVPDVLTIPAHSGEVVEVTYTPVTTVVLDTLLTVTSDASNQPTVDVAVAGSAAPAPALLTEPASFYEELFTGGAVDRNLRVTNTGGSNLNVDLSIELGEASAGEPPVWVELPKGDESDTGSGDFVIARTGGPDAYGYRFTDSDEPGGPVYNWTDISGIGTVIAGLDGDDENSGPIPIGFDFEFYGNTYGTVNVCTNGWLSFTDTGTGYSNPSTLPSTGYRVPENLLAPFFDDLHFRYTDRATYWGDGSKFIVQYTNVERLSTSPASDLTFQVILYPSGKIVFQYEAISGELASTTIGIQNQPRDIGLLVAANEAYLHNGLAVQFSRVPDWLTVAPLSGIIPPGGFQDFTVGFNAGDAGDSYFNGAVVIHTNIPTPPTVPVPASLRVFGVADVATDPTFVDYGTRFVGYPHVRQLRVQNVGTGELTVYGVASDNPELLVEEPPSAEGVFTIPPGGEVLYTLRWIPSSPYALDALVTVESDDPDEPILTVPVTGTSIPAPVFEYAPPSLSSSLFVGETDLQMVTLSNTGGSDLEYNIGIRLTDAEVVAIPSELLEKGEEPAAPGVPVTLGAGGPDMYGYSWKDSDQPGGPVFDWFDISAIGTPVAGLDGDDENVGPVDIGFDFPFYGNTFNTVNLCTNGWLSFTNTTTRLSNASLPTGGTYNPENMLAPFWDDLHFRYEERATTYYDGSRFIVQYTDVERYSTYPSASVLTFQVILYPSGKIVYQYESVTGVLDSSTVGIQNANRDDGLTVVHNAAYLHDELAIAIQASPDWLSADPLTGSISPGESVDIGVRFNATEIIGGTYTGGLSVHTNDPGSPLVDIPMSLFVTGYPEIAADPTALEYGTVFIGVTSQQDVTVTNVGTDVLEVYNVAVTGDYSTDTMPFMLPVGATKVLPVIFAPTAEGPRPGTITLESNATVNMVLGITMNGDGLLPPLIGVEPTPFNPVALPPHGFTTRDLQVCNTGGSDLFWEGYVELIAGSIAPIPEYEDLAKGDESANGTGVGIERVGGPDAYGYSFTDSDEVGGPVFDWFDIHDIGTLLPMTGDDENSGPIPIGFDFPFYGNTFGEIHVNTNGWLSFTNDMGGGSGSYSNAPIPTGGTSKPENMLAPFWDDLHFRYEERATYYNDGTRFIVQYTDVERLSSYPTASYLTFQIILYPDGTVRYQYLSMEGVMDSASVGIQDETRTIGLEVAYNEPYIHDELAIEFSRIPEWLITDPTSGVIPAGDCTVVTLSIDAAGLEEDDYEAIIWFTSNDPFAEVVQVPVLLHVSEVELDWLMVEPNTLNLGSNGKTVKATIQLPPMYDPHDIVISSVSVYGQLYANPAPISYEDSNGDGVLELIVKFDREAFQLLVPEGDDVPVTVTGEVENLTWFTGTDTIRAIRPQMTSPNGGEYLIAGQPVTVTWQRPIMAPGGTFSVWVTQDGGDSWTELASDLSETSYVWTVAGGPTSEAELRVYVHDNRGVMGYDGTDGTFSIADALYPPNAAGSLEVTSDATDVVLRWKAPYTDAYHGPVGEYRILRSVIGRDGFQEIGTTVEDNFRDAHSGHGEASIIMFKVVASNAAGDAIE